MSNVRELARGMLSAAVNNKVERVLIEKIERVCYNDAINICKNTKKKDVTWNDKEFIEEYTYQVNKLTCILNEDHINEIESDDIYGSVRWILMSPQKPKSIKNEHRDIFKKQLSDILERYNVNTSGNGIIIGGDNTNDDYIKSTIDGNNTDIGDNTDSGTTTSIWVNILENNCYQKCIEDAYKERYSAEFEHECQYLYHNLTIKILNNIDPDSSIGSYHLIDQINAGVVTCHNLVGLQSYMFAPKHSEDIRNYLNTQSQQKIEIKTSSYFVCPKCRERKTTYYEKQKRALDEPATIFINCVGCGFNWSK